MNIPGATSTSLQITPTPSQTGFEYRAVFTNLCASTPTSAATVMTFNLCLRDDASGNVLIWNSVTGDYQYIPCGASAPALTGKGIVSVVNGLSSLTDTKPDRKITAGLSSGTRTGRANLVLTLAPGIFQTIVLNQTNPNATCKCH
jgi:hypothetical protein